MHSPQLTIIIAIAVICLIALAYFFRRTALLAIDRAHQEGLTAGLKAQYSRIEALNLNLSRKSALLQSANIDATERNAELTERLTLLDAQLQGLRASPIIQADHDLLVAIAGTLDLALQTWQPIKGTEPVVARATVQKHGLAKLITRTSSLVPATTLLNRDSLDTRLIEFLNTKGDLWGDLENSTVAFPHDANPGGYPHLRDALREALEQEDLRLKLEFSGEAAA